MLGMTESPGGTARVGLRFRVWGLGLGFRVLGTLPSKLSPKRGSVLDLDPIPHRGPFSKP